MAKPYHRFLIHPQNKDYIGVEVVASLHDRGSRLIWPRAKSAAMRGRIASSWLASTMQLIVAAEKGQRSPIRRVRPSEISAAPQDAPYRTRLVQC